MANPGISIFSKKVITTNIENSVEVALCPITHLVLFIQIQTSSMTSFLNSHKFYLYQNVLCIHMYPFCLKLKMVNNVI